MRINFLDCSTTHLSSRNTISVLLTRSCYAKSIFLWRNELGKERKVERWKLEPKVGFLKFPISLISSIKPAHFLFAMAWRTSPLLRPDFTRIHYFLSEIIRRRLPGRLLHGSSERAEIKVTRAKIFLSGSVSSCSLRRA